MKQLIPVEMIQSRIILIRDEKVLFDRDLAELYGVETRRLNEQVSRNIDRFPGDFMFLLTDDEFQNMKSHFAISSWGGTRKLPRVFTEQGIAMLSSVLYSSRAIQVNIAIMRAFVKMRQMLSTHKELKEKFEAMEKKYNRNFKVVFTAIKELMNPIVPEKKTKIGFKPPLKK
ncbi:MAG: ORF6N domain-containing protein [Candidatus Marinimicrobia bacterium]|nr:ORF6N domain-containing protein [Candidatus Neomarinimicrobiota bacterium]MCH7763598.1 ORF6N domain-containing protein [Candidatus Neomarinimicrobiota bacterium]